MKYPKFIVVNAGILKQWGEPVCDVANTLEEARAIRDNNNEDLKHLDPMYWKHIIYQLVE